MAETFDQWGAVRPPTDDSLICVNGNGANEVYLELPPTWQKSTIRLQAVGDDFEIKINKETQAASYSFVIDATAVTSTTTNEIPDLETDLGWPLIESLGPVDFHLPLLGPYGASERPVVGLLSRGAITTGRLYILRASGFDGTGLS